MKFSGSFSTAGRGGSEVDQAEEKAFRNRTAQEELQRGTGDLLKVVGQHHALSPMREYAQAFRRSFREKAWLLDVGTGYAWPWKDAGEGPAVVGIDFSMGNLLLAKRLLGDRRGRVFLICADASRLPFAEGSFDGVWSVQAFQHFPAPIFQRARTELERVLKKRFMMEFHHLHPAFLYRILSRFKGKRLHRRGRCGPFETQRLFLSEWLEKWKTFRGGRFKTTTSYSELFFHPELRFRPRVYPVRLERFLSRCAPFLAALFARQGCLRFKSIKRDD